MLSKLPSRGEINRVRPGAADRLWQPNYYEHVIRDRRSLELIREYIMTKPQRWERDVENQSGDGTDDHERFVRSLTVTPGNEGDTSVAPTEGHRAMLPAPKKEGSRHD